MPRRKKKPSELTDEEAVKKLFPKKALEKARREADSGRQSSIKDKDSK